MRHAELGTFKHPGTWVLLLVCGLSVVVLLFLLEPGTQAPTISTNTNNRAAPPASADDESPPPASIWPTIVHPIKTSTVDAGEGITCVEITRGEETLHWECLR